MQIQKLLHPVKWKQEAHRRQRSPECIAMKAIVIKNTVNVACIYMQEKLTFCLHGN